MRRVYDYKDVRRLDESMLAAELSNGTIITATSDYASAMASYYKNYQVLDVHRFITALIPEWESKKVNSDSGQVQVKDIKNYIQLRNIIADYIIDNNLDGTKIATYLKRNAYDMWNAIMLLVEADVFPSDIPDGMSAPIRRFKDIWEKLEKENEQIMIFRTTFKFHLSLEKKVHERLSASDALKGVKIKKDIFLVGFYFITPIQERIFDVLEKAGHNLIFLNCHDPKYDFATKIWTETFASYYSEGLVKDIQPEISLDNYFGEAIAGNIKKIPIELVKHYSDFEFAEMVKNAVDKNELVYSPNAKYGEEKMMEFYPEFYDQKHLLSYPVGQYVYYLHMLWDSLTDKIDMRFEYVRKCFASGWLTSDKLNGMDYLNEINILEPFFKGCHKFEDWEHRLNVLAEAKEVITSFDERDKGEERWHQLLGNPFLNVGVFDISNEKIKDISTLIRKLIEDAKTLFPEGDRTDLFEHFQRVQQLIKKHCDREEMLEDELTIANELIYQLSDESNKGITCPLSSVRDAIILLIGDHFGSYETQEAETAQKKRMILPMSMVEAAMMSNYGQTVHLVLADEFNMPGAPKELPWPLTNELLNSLKIDTRENTKRYVKAMRSVIDNRPLSYRYLFFSFMGISNDTNKPLLSVEWVCMKDKKDIEISPYINMLKLGDVDESIKGIDESIFDDIRMNNVASVGKTVGVPENVPEEVVMDYLLCKQKYVYSYLLNRLPSYTSEFHYSFELSKLISSLSIVGECDKQDVARQIYQLFPFFRNIELRQSTDFASKKSSIPDPFEWDNVQYPGHVLLPHYLNDDVINIARDRFVDYCNSKSITPEVTADTCKYCQYSNICMEKYKEQIEEYE